MPKLRHYQEKRDPAATPEPMGADRRPRVRSGEGPRAFVVQQHAARRLHWDLRLEIDDVLASWAVPKGPSRDPADKRLAVRTEDHPLEYADFEGVIPAGQYGAGAMIVWDRGRYRTADGSAPARGLAEGKLDLVLEGYKLRGRFALVRTRGADGRQWLLIRKGCAPADPTPLVVAAPASVLSGLTVEELRDGACADREIAQRAAQAGAAQRRLDPARIRPMLAGSADAPFSRPGWLFELKYDGMRVLAWRDAEAVRLVSRTGRDVTAGYPELARALAHLPLAQFVLDGELVALDEQGRSRFELLQARFGLADGDAIARAELETPVQLQAFDLLAAAGHDLRAVPLALRKELLARFVPRLGPVCFADHVEGDGRALLEAARRHGLEGVVAKRADSPYQAGRRSQHWLKIKLPSLARFAVAGWTPGRGSRVRLGALLLAWRRDGAWIYAGRVGSGLDEPTLAALLPRLEVLAQAEPRCTGLPEPLPRGARWVRPELVCEVRFAEVTAAGLLRQPVFVRLREELRPEDCVAPGARAETAELARPAAPEPLRAPAPGLQLTRLDKVFWPVEGFTKGDLLAYYEAVWPWLEPYLKDRPVVLVRYPDGIEGKSFYQKHAPDFTPGWVRREQVDGTDYFVCNDLRTLLYVVNLGAIPLHVWSARLGRLDRPDWLVLDLDPKGAPFRDVVAVARALHRLLASLGAAHFVKTSGQDGLHVLLPLGARLAHEDARRLAELLARVVCAELPEQATVLRPVAARGGRVYVDYLQNGRGKLIAAPLSVRTRPGAPVSMPLDWRQVTARLDPARWNLRTAPRRLAAQGDPLRALLETGVDVPALLAELGQRLAEPG